MSFLAGRLAGKEAAYFIQESKHAIGRLVQKNTTQKFPAQPPPSSHSPADGELQADILPEVLRHSLPSKIFREQSADSNGSLVTSKWVLPSDPNRRSVSSDALNPLRAFLTLPQVTFGPKRWELPQSENSVLASTANDLRADKHTTINPEKLKAAAEGLAHVGKAFAIATALVFGGATLIFGFTVSKLDLNNSNEIQTKGRNLIEPKMEMIREQLVPFKTWAEDMSKKWHVERDKDIKEKPLIKELSKTLGAKTPN
ncbi:uncharacterized protein LOC111007726 [Momordica charantia]|uniref:Uncharacterized protein LOC111007726 n=1 Tax=Momordica charantia TaxID=3673 RepID=A0A6J1C1Z9_MOMCH|nr:uncharacterized protein LOC111007726 [Momordica charantia]